MSAKGGGFFASRKYKLFTKYLSGFGASIVIVGALFKIMHWPGCDVMLIVGLLTEAAIFAFIALEPFHEELDWTRVFPELEPQAAHDDAAEDNRLMSILKKGASGSAADDLADKMDKAGINDALMTKLSNSMSNLAKNAESISDMSNAAGNVNCVQGICELLVEHSRGEVLALDHTVILDTGDERVQIG